MFSAIAKAVHQLADPATRKILWRSFFASAAVFVVLIVAAEWLIAKLRLFDWAALNWTADMLGGVGAFFLALVLFPSVVAAVLGFFVEDVAAAVEAKYYPGLPPPRVQALSEAIVSGLRFAGVAIGLNLLALPFYAIFILVPPVNLLLFYGLNGYLLGREYYELLAARRMAPESIEAVRHVFAGRLFLAGALITFLSTVPFANLLTPVLATAFMVHMVEGLRGEAAVRPKASR